MSKHTPGPWKGFSPGPYIVAATGKRVIAYCGVSEIGNIDMDENFANIRLIAAAPEMLEALEDVESKIVDYEAKRINWRPDDFLFRVRAAIRKAKGEL
jgi:hypothetical protein